MKQQLQLLAALLIVLAATSCRTRTQMTYLTDLNPGVDYPVQPTKDLIIQTDDKITIKVTCKNPELALAFNVPTGGYSISSEGNISSTSNTSNDNRYTVADDGTIDFPVIGKIQARGLTCRQLSETIKNELITRNLITDPYVTSEIVNFTFSVLGEAKKVGTVEVKGKDRVTILEAIAQAGDLSQNAQLDRIAVIREENGKRRVHYVNILSKSIFDSPVYYLKQNDLIYVEPNNNRAREESRRNFQWLWTGTSVITTIFTLINLFKK